MKANNLPVFHCKNSNVFWTLTIGNKLIYFNSCTYALLQHSHHYRGKHSNEIQTLCLGDCFCITSLFRWGRWGIFPKKCWPALLLTYTSSGFYPLNSDSLCTASPCISGTPTRGSPKNHQVLMVWCPFFQFHVNYSIHIPFQFLPALVGVRCFILPVIV